MKRDEEYLSDWLEHNGSSQVLGFTVSDLAILRRECIRNGYSVRDLIDAVVEASEECLRIPKNVHI